MLLFEAEVRLVAEIEAGGVGEEGDRQGGEVGVVRFLHGNFPVNLSGCRTSTSL